MGKIILVSLTTMIFYLNFWQVTFAAPIPPPPYFYPTPSYPTPSTPEPGGTDIGTYFHIGRFPAGVVFKDLAGFGQEFAPAVVRLLFIVGGVAAIFMILIGGLRYVFSGGDEKAVAAARGQITLAVVGLVVLFSVFLILLIIQTLTKFPILFL